MFPVSFSLREKETGKQTPLVSSELMKTGKKQRKLIRATDIQSDGHDGRTYGEKLYRAGFWAFRIAYWVPAVSKSN